MTTTSYAPPVSSVHPAAPLVRALAVVLGGLIAYKLTGALVDGAVSIDAGARGISRMVTLTHPLALLSLALSIYPAALGMSIVGFKPEVLARPGFVKASIGFVALTFVAFLVLNGFMQA